MRCLNKNKQAISYKTYTGKVQTVDSNGHRTGQYTNSYGALASTYMSVSQSGQAVQEAFGVTGNYNLVAMTDDLNCPMDENSIVWFRKSTSGTHNYIVKRKIKGLDHIVYGMVEVTLNA